MIGWVTDLTEANAYYATRYGMIALWAALTSDQKTAVLTTAYNALYHSPLLSIPVSPSAAQLVKLKYAQEEYAGMLIPLGEGGTHRRAIISQGVTSASVVKESYLKESEISTIPKVILDILDDFKTERAFYSYNTYRDETDNDAFDSAFPPI